MTCLRARAAVAVAIAAVACTIAPPAFAYVGPGAGITMLGALWGVLAALVLALAAVVYWPIRAAIRSMRRRGRTAAPVADDAAKDASGLAEREPNP